MTTGPKSRASIPDRLKHLLGGGKKAKKGVAAVVEQAQQGKPAKPVVAPAPAPVVTPVAAPVEVPVEVQVVAPVEPVKVAEPVAPDVVAELIAKVSEGAQYVFVPTPEAADAAQPVGNAVVAGDHGHPLLKLFDGAAKPDSMAKSNGYHIRVPDEFEAAVSTHVVSVTVVARTGGETAKFGLTYGTNEVGNSGWRWFKATTDWATYSLTWPVPQLINGKGDFIGIQPSPAGLPGIEIAVLAAKILD